MMELKELLLTTVAEHPEWSQEEKETCWESVT